MQNRIAVTREYFALTREQLAQRLNVAADTIAAWEDGELSPTPDEAIALAKAFSLPLSFLFCQDPPAQP